MSVNLGEASPTSAQSCPAARAIERLRAGGLSTLSIPPANATTRASSVPQSVAAASFEGARRLELRPAPVKFMSEQEIGAVEARRLLSSQSYGDTRLNAEAEQGASEARKLLAVAGQIDHGNVGGNSEREVGAAAARKLLGK